MSRRRVEATQPVDPAQQSSHFFPPLAMQKSVWDSTLNGDFIDAKIFAFSRRSRESGRVDTPKALFVNTHVLAAACSYFESSTSHPLLVPRRLSVTAPVAFNFSDGTITNLSSGLPPGVDPFFDLEESDTDGDFDDPIDGDDPTEPRPQVSLGIPKQQSYRFVRAYVIKYTAHRTSVGEPHRLSAHH